MKRKGSVAPAGAFTVNRLWDNLADIRFYENVQMTTETLENGNESITWMYDEFVITRSYFEGIEDAIAANYDAWLRQAKAEEEANNPEDAHQLRADIDFIEIWLSSMSAVSVMSVLETDPEILEKVRKYYPGRWSEDRLRQLVMFQKLTPEDFQTVTGVEYSA